MSPVVQKTRKGDWLVSRSCLTVIPEGWLMNPGKTCLLRFIKDPMCLQRVPQVYMDKWSVTSSGTPLSFINRRKVHLDPALETWGELVLNGWEKLEHQFGEAA
tara:strand:+ start:461 stop:769 length:309 start_codon:yes stop_codon:yes gene_type:complete